MRFFVANGWHGFSSSARCSWSITGGEALYADMGHFGRAADPPRLVRLVLPALLLNYFGQGALLLSTRRRARTRSSCWRRPGRSIRWWPSPRCATVIASQAVISGAFSLTRQAVQLGYLPRLTIVHTSSREIGQIYMPAVNWLLMLACIALVLGFRARRTWRRPTASR